MIEIRNVDVVKGGKLLLKNFSWQIRTGENWVIGGKNGSGKTLLLELLSGMLHTPRGEIHYEFVKGKSWDERFAETRAFITYIPAHALQLGQARIVPRGSRRTGQPGGERLQASPARRLTGQPRD